MMQRVSVLIIEDEKSICDFISKILGTNDYKVTSAPTGKEGLEVLTSLMPDIILLDLGLPDMDGLEIIRSTRKWSSIPIIVISARTQEKEKVLALDAGADIVMLDNMSVEMMREAVKMAAGKAETECSGNVTKDNVARLIDIGVDYISSGALTHSAPIMDLSLKNLHAID